MVKTPNLVFPQLKEAALAASFFLLASAAILLTRFNGGIALLWVANAPLILFLCNQHTVRRWWTALAWTALASIAASTLFGPVAWAAPFFGLASIFEAAVAALLLRRWLRGSDPFGSVRSVVIFVAIAGLIGPATGALIGATTAFVALDKSWIGTFIDWIVGRGLGTLTASPIVMLVMAGKRRVWAPRLLSQLWGEGALLHKGDAARIWLY